MTVALQEYEPIYVFEIDGGDLDGRVMKIDDARGFNEALFDAIERHIEQCNEIGGATGTIRFIGEE
jgi:hypothetical protein